MKGVGGEINTQGPPIKLRCATSVSMLSNEQIHTAEQISPLITIRLWVIHEVLLFETIPKTTFMPTFNRKYSPTIPERTSNP